MSLRSAGDSGAKHGLVVDSVQGFSIHLDPDFRASCECEATLIKHATHKLLKHYVEKLISSPQATPPIALESIF